MSLRNNLSRLSPNEFLEKMQDMFQMYQESQDDYYEEGLNEARKNLRNSDSNYNNSHIPIIPLSDIKKTMSSIARFIERVYSGVPNRKVDRIQATNHMKSLLKEITFKRDFKVENLLDLVYCLYAADKELGSTTLDPLIRKHYQLQRELAQR